jgi:hypothetical protein
VAVDRAQVGGVDRPASPSGAVGFSICFADEKALAQLAGAKHCPHHPYLKPQLAGSFPIAAQQLYPLVTTGGGALPLPVHCVQPAMLSRANTAAVARMSFFIAVTFVMTAQLNA